MKSPVEKNDRQQKVRKSLKDYGDGANTTHYLGNDDYLDGTNLPDDNVEDDAKLSGKEATGNLFMDEDEFVSEKDKSGFEDISDSH